MKKAWRNPREIIVHQLSPEPEDARRSERLMSLLATGVERLLAAQSQNSVSNVVDFEAKVSPNVHDNPEATQAEIK